VKSAAVCRRQHWQICSPPDNPSLQAFFHLFAFVKRGVDYVNSSIHRAASACGDQRRHIHRSVLDTGTINKSILYVPVQLIYFSLLVLNLTSNARNDFCIASCTVRGHASQGKTNDGPSTRSSTTERARSSEVAGGEGEGERGRTAGEESSAPEMRVNVGKNGDSANVFRGYARSLFSDN